MDAMAVYAKQCLGFPRERVLGMGGALDSARFRTFLAEAIGVSFKDVSGMVIGNHGDAMMPLVRLANVSGVPVTELLSKEQLDAISARTKTAGAEIGGLLKTGSAFYAPAAGSVEMAEAILKDQKRVISCAVELNGEYGVTGLFVGVPCIIGKNGLEKILTVELNADEKVEFVKSVAAVQALVDGLKNVQ
jgi:malate dehydrogenase